VTPESHDTLIAAAAYVTNTEARVDIVDDDDELTQRYDDDSSDECYIDMPGLQQRHDDDSSSDNELYIDMPGLQQRHADDSSSDDDSVSYQQEFEIDAINDSGETATVTINKVEHVIENNADPPDEIRVGQITQDINNKTNRTSTTKEEDVNMDDDVFAVFSGNITTKEDIANMDNIVFAENQREE
jgi:hypothetical protein